MQYVTFFPIIFLKKCHLLIDKQKEHISIKFTASLIFFLARECQYKTNKIRIIILSHFQLKIYNLQDCKHSKSIYLTTFKSTIKISELYISYFYKILHFLRNTTKFGSPKLDIYNSTYDFLKLAYISEINELAFKSTAADSWDP